MAPSNTHLGLHLVYVMLLYLPWPETPQWQDWLPISKELPRVGYVELSRFSQDPMFLIRWHGVWSKSDPPLFLCNTGRSVDAVSTAPGGC